MAKNNENPKRPGDQGAGNNEDWKDLSREIRPIEQTPNIDADCDEHCPVCHGTGFTSGFLMLPCPYSLKMKML